MSRVQVPSRRYGPFEDLSTDMERMFDTMLGRTFGTMLRTGGNNEKFMPTVDVAESPQGFEISVDLPGIKPEDVKVELQDGHLVVSGNRDCTNERKDKDFHCVERASGSFLRAIALPADVDSEKIDAQYEHGVLRVTLPKSPKAQPKKIQIRSKS